QLAGAPSRLFASGSWNRLGSGSTPDATFPARGLFFVRHDAGARRRRRRFGTHGTAALLLFGQAPRLGFEQLCLFSLAPCFFLGTNPSLGLGAGARLGVFHDLALLLVALGVLECLQPVRSLARRQLCLTVLLDHLSGARGCARLSPGAEAALALDLDRYGLGPPMRKALPHLTGLDGLLNLEAPRAGEVQRPFAFLFVGRHRLASIPFLAVVKS